MVEISEISQGPVGVGWGGCVKPDKRDKIPYRYRSSHIVTITVLYIHMFKIEAYRDRIVGKAFRPLRSAIGISNNFAGGKPLSRLSRSSQATL